MTTPPNPLTELAERVEKLTGPCRETDARIQCALDGHQFVSFSDKRGMDQISTISTGEKTLGVVLAYTASLDAAMTLVPENHEWEAGTALLTNAAWAGVIGLDGRWQAKAATPSLALTAAILRARAASESSHG